MKKLTTLLILILSFTLVSCGDLAQQDAPSPGDAARNYFDALYNKKDMPLAVSMATPSLARIMKSYGSAKQFTRNLVNLQYDNVVIEIDMSNLSVRQQYEDKAKVNLIFIGYLNSKKIDDMRSVEMIREDGIWYVDKIVPDPYAR